MKLKVIWEYEGETGEYIDESNYGTLENALFQWREGNFSCDCNRSKLFGLTEKYPERCKESLLSQLEAPQKEERDEWDFPCGKTIKVLSIEQIQE